MDAETENLGQWVTRHRKAAGLTQSALGERVGVSGAYISSIERGTRYRPKLEVVMRLAHTLVRPIDEVMVIMGYTGRTCQPNSLIVQIGQDFEQLSLSDRDDVTKFLLLIHADIRARLIGQQVSVRVRELER